MAIIIPFPKPHRDYDYKIESCAGCQKILTEIEQTTEVFNDEGKTVEYLCRSCSNTFIKKTD